MSWRIGTKIPINVYDEDRPVCQCHTVFDAKLIVEAVNFWQGTPATGRAIQSPIEDGKASS